MTANSTKRQPGLVTQLLEPGFYPHGPEAVELRETNTSWVFLAGPLVYKVKRPVRFAFLDYSTLERRLEMCRAEVDLNRELAPGTYLGVRSVTRSDGHFALSSESDPEAVEFAVEMRRLPEERCMARLARAGELTSDQVDAVARRVAGFHATAARAPAEFRRLDPLLESVKENLVTLRSVGSPVLGADRVAAAEGFTAAFIERRRADFASRAEGGFVRHCHGDLRAEHVILAEEVLIFDRLEFDPGRRWIDIASEVAFLRMDLEAHGAVAAAKRFVATYRDSGGDAGDDVLIAFFCAYRAWIRAKIACLRAAALGVDADKGRGDGDGRGTAGPAMQSGQASAAVSEAQMLFALGHRFAWQARGPLVLIVCGVSASGKTTLAEEVARISGFPRVSSDETRKGLAGLAPTGPAGPERYSDHSSHATYRALGEQVASALAEHGGAIVDATFRRAEDQDAYSDGLDGAEAPTVFVQTSAPRSELLRRARERGTSTVSDADETIVERQLEERFEAPAAEDSLLRVRTDRPISEIVLDVESFVYSRDSAFEVSR